ncbi:Hypothetical predicted protein [Xyrichtys novacula]|uniref:Uncharacterized protein n=1 Tax=Xyrichtys novacula TaxID=13765 RepID=A0AAV1HP61_XYRNO|nr:Hypothetical predicted protein [Xyrichtys novacula]
MKPKVDRSSPKSTGAGSRGTKPERSPNSAETAMGGERYKNLKRGDFYQIEENTKQYTVMAKKCDWLLLWFNIPGQNVISKMVMS